MRRLTTSNLWLLTCLGALGWSRPAEAAKIACVGDSITFGYGLSDANTQSYPAVLQTLLGASHTVRNFGVSGTTLLKNGDRPYWDEANFGASGDFAPDVVIVMLGTNDAKAQNWSHASEFAGDYDDLVAHYRGLGALVYVAAPPPVYAPGAYDIQPDVLNDDIVPRVRQIASDLGAPLVDVYQALSSKPDDFPDTVHPNADGARIIAETVNAALASNGFGGDAAGGAGGSSQGGRANSDGGRTTAAGTGFGGVGTAGLTSGVSGGRSGVEVAGLGGGAGIGGTAASAGASGIPAVGGMLSAASGGGSNSAGNHGSGGATAGAFASGAAGGGVSGTSGLAGTGGAGVPRAAHDDTSDGGCGCRVERTRNSRGRATLLACFALIAITRRRPRLRA